MILIAIIVVVLSGLFTKNININQCSSKINEESEKYKIIAKYEKITSIASGSGFSRESGHIYEGDQVWRFNRYSTFTVTPLSNEKFKLKILSITKSDDDDVPEGVMRNFRPEQSRITNLINIEEVSPDIWLISGLGFPLFACKEN